jgi:hypothetical protein
MKRLRKPRGRRTMDALVLKGIDENSRIEEEL